MIARGDAICSGTLSGIRAVAPPAGGSVSALATYLDKVRPVIDRQAAQIAALPRPPAERQTLDRFVAAVTAADRAYRRAAAAASAGDAGGVSQALSSLRANPAATLARRYGLTACTGTAATVS